MAPSSGRRRVALSVPSIANYFFCLQTRHGLCPLFPLPFFFYPSGTLTTWVRASTGEFAASPTDARGGSRSTKPTPVAPFGLRPPTEPPSGEWTVANVVNLGHFTALGRSRWL